MGAASERTLQVWIESSGSSAQVLSDVRLTLLHNGEPVPLFAFEPVNGSDTPRLFVVRFQGQPSRTLLETEQVRVEALGTGGTVEAAETVDAVVRWRTAEERTLQITASLLAGGGGAPLAGVEALVGGVTVTLPATLAFPRGTTVPISAASVVRAKNGEPAPFYLWDGFAQSFPGWDNQRPIPGDRRDPAFQIVLDNDTRVEVRYASPRLEGDAPVRPR
jgi:hypothetical protein